MHKAVLVDTCFLVKLLNSTTDLHENAKDYYDYFIRESIIMKVSTITLAEYCVKGSLEDIPLRSMQILGFNFPHSDISGKFAETVFRIKRQDNIQIEPRNIIPNDSKLFAQASYETSIGGFVSSDSKAKLVYDIIQSEHIMNFDYWDINTPISERQGILF